MLRVMHGDFVSPARSPELLEPVPYLWVYGLS